MLSPLLLWSRACKRQEGTGGGKEEEPSLKPNGNGGCVSNLVQWLPALEGSVLKHKGKDASDNKNDDGDENAQLNASENKMALHAAHRRALYLHHAKHLSQYSDAHDYYRLMMWCHDQHIFIHPTVRIHRRPSPYRDHAFVVTEDVDRLTPLFAIPEALAIGFKDTSEAENNLRDEEREKEFNKLNTGEQSDADICQFFFDSLGMIVSDLITSIGSPLTDPRWAFAELLGRVRSMKNAPYFEDDVVLDAEATGLADVLLQMIRNYINGGPLVGKVDRAQLRWAVSICLSHSTPLVIGATRSIGIIPMVHLFPHGGKNTNSLVVARTSQQSSATRMAAYFARHHQYDFMCEQDGKWIYVVPARALRAGEEICMQTMAPVCGKDSEAEKMWRLSCGTPPEDYVPSAAVAHQQDIITNELIRKGEQIISTEYGK
ncbi:uncharacterized protein TEOVI_000809400 [Trypanosoma equiperdum]|uniref:Uncharacterized protein n=1 Tax=Trypanosoma equiperdum TaxID=5694 RepID=A0A1G4I6I9_TRYEQ|nr:hypothetical protein, conserved [Trypanosoma equiperdum]